MEKKKILVIGSSNTDMTVKTTRLPLPGETVLGGRFVMGAGGKGANQAVAAKRLGGETEFICKVGNDIFGRNSVEGYKKEGLGTGHILTSGEPSGVALISVDENAENCIVVASGANGDFTPEDVHKIEDVIREADILLMQLEIPVETVEVAAAVAAEAGVKVILNPAPAADLPDSLLEKTDLLIPNALEVSSISGMPADDVESILKAVKSIQAKGVKDVIVTVGSKGSIVCQKDEYQIVPPFKVKAVDTTGAGDTYCGALCVALAEGKTLPQAALFATAASALAVTKMGAQDAVPTQSEVMKMLEERL